MIDGSRLAVHTARQIIRRPAHRKPGIMDYENLEGWAEMLTILRMAFRSKKPRVKQQPQKVFTPKGERNDIKYISFE